MNTDEPLTKSKKSMSNKFLQAIANQFFFQGHGQCKAKPKSRRNRQTKSKPCFIKIEQVKNQSRGQQSIPKSKEINTEAKSKGQDKSSNKGLYDFELDVSEKITHLCHE